MSFYIKCYSKYWSDKNIEHNIPTPSINMGYVVSRCSYAFFYPISFLRILKGHVIDNYAIKRLAQW